ncbi:hypothetical protein G4B88_007883 [Cannabis sativa]|uniref:Uncharacterized protein n=1 Tax=Cannabis sativa TaxID=3483 RepID=A0A7J6DQH6_CANSA|nr:hypothetical protein G4B88_007883 [Cannabis sativa]
MYEHETPQIEIPSAHDNSVWDLAWHPIGYLLCSGSNDHTTKFWCRNRPGDTARDFTFNMGQIQGYGEQNPALAGRFTSIFPVSDGPTTPGPFPLGLTRNEGTIPGVGVAMPLSIPSLDPSAQGDQKHHLISMSLGASLLPSQPHPSLTAANQQQLFEQYPQHMPQQHQTHHQALPQQRPSMPMPPNMQQRQPTHLPLLPNPHLSRPPPQIPPRGFSSSVPASLPMPSSLPSHSMPRPMEV